MRLVVVDFLITPRPKKWLPVGSSAACLPTFYPSHLRLCRRSNTVPDYLHLYLIFNVLSPHQAGSLQVFAMGPHCEIATRVAVLARGNDTGVTAAGRIVAYLFPGSGITTIHCTLSEQYTLKSYPSCVFVNCRYVFLQR